MCWRAPGPPAALLSRRPGDLALNSACAASCHVELSNLGARLEDGQAELEGCQLTANACAQEKASLQEAWQEASAKQFPPGTECCYSFGSSDTSCPALTSDVLPTGPASHVPATPAAEEYVACANELITLKIANETFAAAAGECQGQLADVERSYQECMSRNRRLLKLPGGRPALPRTTA